MKTAMIALSLLASCIARADCCSGQPIVPPPPPSPGSTAFCLVEIPDDDSTKRKWVNLGIVQYIELNQHDVRLYFGGGNFGGGYETKIPVASTAEGLALIDRIKQAAAACK